MFEFLSKSASRDNKIDNKIVNSIRITKSINLF